jgi:hypothetical protein
MIAKKRIDSELPEILIELYNSAFLLEGTLQTKTFYAVANT